MRKLTYFVATSLDGFIAAPDGTFDAFPMEGDHIEGLLRDYPETFPAPALAALGVTPDNATFDTVIMGWETYNVGRSQGLESPYPHLRQYVCTRNHLGQPAPEDVTLVGDEPLALAAQLKAEAGDKDIWLCGGGALAAALQEEIDRLVLKVNPVMLGSGIPLFRTAAYAPRNFTLTRSHVFKDGVVMCDYVRA